MFTAEDLKQGRVGVALSDSNLKLLIRLVSGSLAYFKALGTLLRSGF